MKLPSQDDIQMIWVIASLIGIIVAVSTLWGGWAALLAFSVAILFTEVMTRNAP